MLMKMKPVNAVMNRMETIDSMSVLYALKASLSSLVSSVIPKMKKMMHKLIVVITFQPLDWAVGKQGEGALGRWLHDRASMLHATVTCQCASCNCDVRLRCDVRQRGACLWLGAPENEGGGRAMHVD